MTFCCIIQYVWLVKLNLSARDFSHRVDDAEFCYHQRGPSFLDIYHINCMALLSHCLMT